MKQSSRGGNEGRTGHLSQFGVVNEVGSVSVDEGAQSQAILPTEPGEEEGGGGRGRDKGGNKERRVRDRWSDRDTTQTERRNNRWKKESLMAAVPCCCHRWAS